MGRKLIDRGLILKALLHQSAKDMLAVAFSILVLFSLLSIFSNITMRIRLSIREPSRDKLIWWRLGSSEVTNTYEELYPSSYLPFFSQFAFWLLLGLASVGLAAILWKSH